MSNLLHLEHDAIAAYDSTIERLDDEENRQQIEVFRQDHLDHVKKLEQFAGRLGIDAPTGGDIKQMVTTGKVALAGLAGDEAIIKAMKTNEDDTVQAYEQAVANTHADAEMKPVFAKALEDEQRHRAWMETASSQ
ncbi:MAG: ferritin-like domain-containing protein [Loktanella sp.]|nr:ferritin-like domain-containing protein [Loktanella sp.]